MEKRTMSLLKATERMRALQKEAARTGAPSAVAAAKRSEREVDEIVRIINDALAQESQPELEGGEK